MQNQEDVKFRQLSKTDRQMVFTKTYNKYFKYLCNTAYDILKDVDEAKDVCQEVCIKVWQQIDSIEIDVSLQSYLTKSVRNSCFNKIKKDKRSPLNGTFREDIEIASESTDYYTLKEEQRKVVNEILENLPEKMRRTLKEIYQEDHSTDEIAEERGLSKNTILAQRQSGLKKIRSEIKKIFRKTN